MKHYIHPDSRQYFAFNIWSMETAKAVIDAASRVSRNVILQTSMKVFESLDKEEMRAFVTSYSQKKNICAYLHLDHCRRLDVILKAADLGWDSVMIDASDKPLSENIILTNEVCAAVRGKDILVEAEIGQIGGTEEESFVEIRGKKLIEYNLALLKKYGVDEIIIVTGYQSEEFEKLVADEKNIRLIYNPFYEMVNVLGSFYMGMDALYDDFIYMHADTLCEPCILEKHIRLDGDIILPVEYKQCDDEAMKVRSENGRIVQNTKRMNAALAEGEFIGIAAFRKEVIPLLKEKTKQLLKEKAFTEYFEGAIQRLIDDKENFSIKAVSTDGAFWAEIDFQEDYKRAVEEIPESLTDIFG